MLQQPLFLDRTNTHTCWDTAHGYKQKTLHRVTTVRENRNGRARWRDWASASQTGSGDARGRNGKWTNRISPTIRLNQWGFVKQEQTRD